jgi:putative ABC transport system ATP-binding protein
MTTPAIAVTGLTKTYGEGSLGVRAVRGVDLTIEAGEVVLIMGPSGSGKTTLLLMIGAMLRPTSGSIMLAGIDVAATPEHRLPSLRARNLGFVFQDFNLLTALTARENVELACNLAGVTGRKAADRARELLKLVGLDERLEFRPDQLSGGEKQRVAIARSLANRPTLILADEPTANLDSSHGREIARLLRRLAHEQGCSIIIVSHDERLREIADRTLWLADGQLQDLDAMATDPVCSMTVQPSDTTPHYSHQATTYWFCSVTCRDEFAHGPDRFLIDAVARTRDVGLDQNDLDSPLDLTTRRAVPPASPT